MTKSQVDRLGERLRTQGVTEADLRLLDEYRRSFTAAYATVIETVRDRLRQEPTGRPAKSTLSIVDKLKRESIRLSQMQDVAGCRVVVSDVFELQSAIDSLSDAFEETAVVDRRQRPSHGYRAVHVIAFVNETPIEIQVRTTLQHLWAEFSEKLSDVIDPALKYGGGTDDIRSALAATSATIATEEALELTIAANEAEFIALREKAARVGADARSILTRLDSSPSSPSQAAAREMLERSEKNLERLEKQIDRIREDVRLDKERVIALKEKTAVVLREAIARVTKPIGDW